MYQEKESKIIADLMFAFINQDEDFPHNFEINAFEQALVFLQNHYQDNEYNLKMFEKHLKKMIESEEKYKIKKF